MAYRKKAAAFPMGFRCQLTPDVLIIDFLDQTGGEEEGEVFNSIALTKDIAKNLADSLLEFVDGTMGRDDDDDER